MLNMAFFSVNWDVFISCLAKELGFTSESALNYAKGAKNHHHAMTMLNILERGNWCELLLPYVRERMASKVPLSVNDYLYQWLPNVKCRNYLYILEQTWRYIGSIRTIVHMSTVVRLYLHPCSVSSLSRQSISLLSCKTGN